MMTARELYLEMYPGGSGKIPSEQVSCFIERARFEVNRITGGRADESIDGYLLCLLDIAECLYLDAAGGAVASESIDGYSVSYKESEAPEKECEEICRRYFSGSGILYRGLS